MVKIIFKICLNGICLQLHGNTSSSLVYFKLTEKGLFKKITFVTLVIGVHYHFLFFYYLLLTKSKHFKH